MGCEIDKRRFLISQIHKDTLFKQCFIIINVDISYFDLVDKARLYAVIANNGVNGTPANLFVSALSTAFRKNPTIALIDKNKPVNHGTFTKRQSVLIVCTVYNVHLGFYARN